MAGKGRLTQRDIARIAGVSQATVSLVLNDAKAAAGRIPDDTRERVQKAIRETGYVADPIARRMARGLNRILGVFTYEPAFPSAQADFFAPFLFGIEETAQMLGYDLLLNWVAITASLGAVGALAAGAHPLSILAAALSSPITPLHPALSSGMVSGAVETWVRKPRVEAFARLRDDVMHVKGWWRNAVTRVFLVFFLTSAGTAIGVWLAIGINTGRVATQQ